MGGTPGGSVMMRWPLASLSHVEYAASSLDNVKTVVDIVGTIITAAAVIVAAVWAYYRFVKDRTYRPRLDVSMEGEWLSIDGRRVLMARVRVKSIGASVVHLVHRGSGLRVSTPADSNAQGKVNWLQGRVHPVLEKHDWIEPGETVSDDVLLELAVLEGRPVLLEARLVWRWPGSQRNIVVFARQVLPADSIVARTRTEPSEPEDEGGDRK